MTDRAAAKVTLPISIDCLIKQAMEMGAKQQVNALAEGRRRLQCMTDSRSAEDRFALIH